MTTIQIWGAEPITQDAVERYADLVRDDIDRTYPEATVELCIARQSSGSYAQVSVRARKTETAMRIESQVAEGVMSCGCRRGPPMKTGRARARERLRRAMRATRGTACYHCKLAFSVPPHFRCPVCGAPTRHVEYEPGQSPFQVRVRKPEDAS
jgi:hypothetical protein